MVWMVTFMPACWKACCRNWAPRCTSELLVAARVNDTGWPVCCCTCLTSFAASVGLYFG